MERVDAVVCIRTASHYHAMCVLCYDEHIHEPEVQQSQPIITGTYNIRSSYSRKMKYFGFG